MLHVELLREKGFCDAVRLRNRDTFLAVRMASFNLEASPRQLPRSLTCCACSLTAHMLYVKLLREEEFCGAARFQDHDTFELYAWQASSWKRHTSAVAPKLDLVPRVSRPIKLARAKITPLSLFSQPLSPVKPGILARIRNLCGSSSSMTRVGSGFASRKLSSSPVSPWCFRHTRGLKLHEATASRRKLNKLIVP